MPRAKIMKICYIILDKLKEIPEDAMYRIYTEEKLKYIMRNTDEIEDIRTLEETFGNFLILRIFFEREKMNSFSIFVWGRIVEIIVWIGLESIEMFIQALHKEITLVDLMKGIFLNSGIFCFLLMRNSC